MRDNIDDSFSLFFDGQLWLVLQKGIRPLHHSFDGPFGCETGILRLGKFACQIGLFGRPWYTLKRDKRHGVHFREAESPLGVVFGRIDSQDPDCVIGRAGCKVFGVWGEMKMGRVFFMSCEPSIEKEAG
jgi:hypothetical protein